MRRISSRTKSCCLVACLAMLGALTTVANGADYLGPCDVVASKDGKSVFVLNKDADQIAVVVAETGKVAQTIACPASPTGITLHPSGTALCVTSATPEGSVAIIELKTGTVAATIPAGHGATAPVISPNGKRLYVCNQFDNDVSVINLATKKELARIPVIREPVGSAITPDGSQVFVTNLLPLDRSDSYNVASAVSVIDTADNSVKHVRLPNGSSSVEGVCVSPDGKYAYAVHILARYQMPTTQLERGWQNTNAMSIIDVATGELINTVLLDDIDLGGANPFGVATTADGKQICVTHAGTHELSVIDAVALLDKLKTMPKTVEEARAAGRDDYGSGSYSSMTVSDVPNDLAFLVGLRQRIKLGGNGPRGLAIIGTKVYIAEYFTDTLSIVDLTAPPRAAVTPVALGPKPVLSKVRQGEQHFYDAALCFQHWQACASCHPRTRVDALNWDLLNDGLGNPKNVKSMLAAHKTPPAMASGIRPNAEAGVRAGITHIQFAVRPEEDAVAIDEYLKALPQVPSPHLVDGKLSASAKRGKKLFEGDRIGCAQCHPSPLYTDMQMHDVGSRGKYDRRDDFDTPSLLECWRTAPYMHDGHWLTIKELISDGKHGEYGGDIESLSDKELDDLAEYVLSL